MRAFARLRHGTRPAIMVVVLALVFATAGAAIGASLHLPNIITPHSERQVTNLDVLRLELKNYYGTPGAPTGSGATAGWTLQLNLDSYYAKEAEKVAREGTLWLKAYKNLLKPMKAIVLDVDDTTLATWNYELFSNWDYNPGTNASFVGLTGTTFTGNLFPAVPGMVEMVNWAASRGYAVFFITGRGDSQHATTIANLVNDTAAGLSDISSVTFSGATLPEMDASYVMPTPAAIGHGGFTDGLFTKPPVGSYPAYLDKPEFCGPYIHATPAASCPTVQYKSGTRAYIESLGWDIVADFGDQFSDLLGGYADNTFKMPNPNYYLP